MLLATKIAIAFLTILPVRLPAELPADGLKRSAGFFPLAGWLIGGFLAGCAWICVRAGLPPMVSAVLLVTLGAWLTRGLHLDGLADLLDGLGGGQTPERRLAIMKDSATGAFGVIGLVLLLGLKVACLAALVATEGEPLFFALLTVPATARWAMTTLACDTQYPREIGTGHAFVGKVGLRELALGGLLLMPLIWWNWSAGLIILGAAMLPALWLRFKASKALGGVTGDVLGASCELGEACGWLAAVVVFSV
ncbi:MAG: adenosylcobinamide-GDP ribazoletransferase [Proteobacteria bacterium]|jgi:adenosylcobinamide-GDP ribazoletransferase|nr:adenosylcobinamide-GDP ribazoletransferase [Pseudomonadota bacterium]MBU4407318.1 adenosylcobinamide-GDP ribazoletransferase [Pseudomonadota bacterium]MCG2824843.1 adenosylcobinamide-GDP ribazoletransferase [Desulfobulbaceae bacterium]